MTIVIMSVAFYLKLIDRLGDWAFVSLILVPAIVYLFVNGAIKINSIKTNFDKVQIDLEGDKEAE